MLATTRVPPRVQVSASSVPASTQRTSESAALDPLTPPLLVAWKTKKVLAAAATAGLKLQVTLVAAAAMVQLPLRTVLVMLAVCVPALVIGAPPAVLV